MEYVSRWWLVGLSTFVGFILGHFPLEKPSLRTQPVEIVSGCNPASPPDTPQQAAVRGVNDLLLAADMARIVAQEAYRTEQLLVVNRAWVAGVSKEEVKGRVQKVRDKWKPVWEAFGRVYALQIEVQKAADVLDKSEKLRADLAAAVKQVSSLVEEARVADIGGDL